MRPYEQILDKIAPVFYKLEQYQEDFVLNDQGDLIDKYLEYANIPLINYFVLPKTAYYMFSAGYTYDIIKYPAGYFKVRLITQYKLPVYPNSQYVMDIDFEFIINIIINKFSFENEVINTKNADFVFENRYENVNLNLDFKKYFIVLVGKDMYDTIRENIK